MIKLLTVVSILFPLCVAANVSPFFDPNQALPSTQIGGQKRRHLSSDGAIVTSTVQRRSLYIRGRREIKSSSSNSSKGKGSKSSQKSTKSSSKNTKSKSSKGSKSQTASTASGRIEDATMDSVENENDSGDDGNGGSNEGGDNGGGGGIDNEAGDNGGGDNGGGDNGGGDNGGGGNNGGGGDNGGGGGIDNEAGDNGGGDNGGGDNGGGDNGGGDNGGGDNGGGDDGGGGDNGDGIGGDPEATVETLKYAMLRTSLGTSIPLSEYPVIGATSGIRGELRNLVENADGSYEAGTENLGTFYATCTVVDAGNLHLQCEYELIDSTQTGVLIMSGPTVGMQYLWNVSGTGYTFEKYSGGAVRALADPLVPSLYVIADLY